MPGARTFHPLLAVGLVLLVSAGLLGPLVGQQVYLTRLVLLGGLVAVVWGAVLSARSWLDIYRRVRRTTEPGPGRLWLLVGLLALILSIGFSRQNLRFDTTRRGLNSLSPASREALARPGRDVELIGAYRETHPAAAQVREILRLYRTQGGGIRARMLDPEREPEEARRLGLRVTSALLVRADSVLLPVEELSEEAITTAILRARHPRGSSIVRLDGHGEAGSGRAGFGELERLARQTGNELRAFDLRIVSDVPADIRTVLVTGPTSELLPGEIGALRRFLDRGGRLGVFVDPGSPTGLEGLLAHEQIQLDGRRIRDDGPLTRSVGLGPETIAVQSLGEHEVTRGLTSAIVLRGATRVAPPPVTTLGPRLSVLLRSSPNARLAADAPRFGNAAGSDAPAQGVLPLGMAVEWTPRPDSASVAAPPGNLRERPATRLLVVGDGDFLRDDTIGLYGNRAFAGRILSWLSQRDFALEIPPVDRSGTPLRAGLPQFRAIFLVVEVLLPLGVFAWALALWWRRR